jgi:hypothetical protein
MDEKDCFGSLDRVFPAGDKGLREVVPGCHDCAEKVPCLRAALCSPEGIEMRAEMLDRAVARGIMGTLQGWSMEKELNRLKEERKRTK